MTVFSQARVWQERWHKLEWPSRATWQAIFQSHRETLQHQLLLSSFFLVLSVLTYAPLLSSFDEALIGRAQSDVMRNAWGFWWYKAMLLERFSLPVFTTYLNYPAGTTLLVIDPLHCLLSVPLQLLMGLPLAFNLMVVGITAFNGYGAAVLTRALTGQLAPALLVGTLYGFAPYVLSNALSGNTELLNTGWIPLLFLAVIRLVERPSRSAGAWLGVTLVLTTLASWYYGYMAGLFGLVLLLLLTAEKLPTLLREPPLRRALGEGLFTAGLLFVGFSLVMLLLFHEIIPGVRAGIGQGGLPQREVLAGNAVNLWEIYAPGKDRWDRPSLYHLPVDVLSLLGILLVPGLWRGKKWGLLGLLGLLLSLSFKEQNTLFYRVPSVEPLLMQATALGQALYGAFLSLPFAGAIRFPIRFVVMLLLGVGIMAGFGLALVLTPLENLLSRWRVTKLILPVLGMGGGLLLHAQLLTAARFPDILVQTPVERPGWIRVLQDDETPGAVVHMPTDLQGREQLLFQSQHERPLMGYIDFVTGFNARLPHGQVPLSFSDALYGLQMRGYDDKIRGYPLRPPPWPKAELHREQLVSLRRTGLRYLVLDRSRFEAQTLEAFEGLMQDQMRRVYAEGSTEVYRFVSEESP